MKSLDIANIWGLSYAEGMLVEVFANNLEYDWKTKCTWYAIFFMFEYICLGFPPPRTSKFRGLTHRKPKCDSIINKTTAVENHWIKRHSLGLQWGKVENQTGHQ
jgi:hypothetical protein